MDEYNTVSGADAELQPEETVSEGDVQLPAEPGAREPEEETTAALPSAGDTAAENESLVTAVVDLQQEMKSGFETQSAISLAVLIVLGLLLGSVWIKGFWGGK